MLRRNSDWHGRFSEKAIRLRLGNICAFSENHGRTSGSAVRRGLWDQGRYSLAELPRSTVVDVPAAIPVRFMPQTDAFVAKAAGGDGAAIGPSTGACLFDYDGDGKPDFSL